VFYAGDYLKRFEMAKIFAPNKDYSGISAGVHFVNGQGETEDESAIQWLLENGYSKEAESGEVGVPEEAEVEETDAEETEVEETEVEETEPEVLVTEPEAPVVKAPSKPARARK
jgi:hypothetical protein